MISEKSLTRRQFVQGAAAVAVVADVPARASDRAEPKPARHPRRRHGMYVSIRDEIMMGGGFASVAEGLAFLGLDGVEVALRRDYTVRAIVPTDDKPRLRIDQEDDVARLVDQFHATGTHMTAFLIPNNFNSPEIDSEIAWVVRAIEVAARLGAPAVRIDAIMEGETKLPLADREQIFGKAIRSVLEKTRGLNVDLGIENHGVKGNDPDFLEGEFKLAGSRRVGVTMDIGNFYWAGYPLDDVYKILERLAPHTKHTHIKNIRYPADIRETRRVPGYMYSQYVCPIPDGDIDVKRVVGYLKAAGYKRDLCIEDESLGRFDRDTRREHMRSAVAYLDTLI